MRAIFHIGHHKTGTTSLQTYLAANAGHLLEVGILSPWVESQGAVWAQARALHGDSLEAATETELLPANVREPHNALAFRMLSEAVPERRPPPYHPGLPGSAQMLLAIRNQIEILAPDAVVICSEVMSHFGAVAPELIDRLSKAVAPAEFHLHITLRRPDEQLVAWHGQMLRFGNKAPALSDPQGGIDLAGIHVDYRRVVQPWLDRLPSADISLRPYRETLAAGGAIEDFFTSAHLTQPEGAVSVPKMNIGLPPALFALLREANHTLPTPVAKGIAEHLGLLAEGLELPAAGQIEFFGTTARARLVAHFEPIHAWLSECSGRPAFFDDLDDMARTRAMTEGEALRAALDQLSPTRIKLLPGPRMRDFVTNMRETYRPAPLA